MNDSFAREGARDALYDVPFTTGHTGVVSGGTALNIVPESCVFEFEFRTIAADNIDALVDEVVRYARERLEPEMKAVSPEAGITFEEKSEFPRLDTPAPGHLGGLAQKLGPSNAHRKGAFGTAAGRVFVL